MFNITPIFPTPLVCSNIGRELTKKEINFCETARKDFHKNKGNVYSQDVYVLENTELKEIKKYIESGIDYYSAFVLSAKADIEFYITQSWLNYTDIGQHHHLHAHSNAIISGVFYINADPSVDSISFKRMRYEQISIFPQQWNVFNTGGHTRSVSSGDLVLFPSSLFHTVSPTTKDDTRISLAFNVFARGEIGEPSHLNSLIL
jgi:uncharacterized protein (TIGR02466 family)